MSARNSRHRCPPREHCKAARGPGKHSGTGAFRDTLPGKSLAPLAFAWHSVCMRCPGNGSTGTEIAGWLGMARSGEKEVKGMIASPKSATSVSEFLEDYLRFRLSVPDLHFLKAPSSVTEGWETDVYRFTLAGDEELPQEFQRPLILRAYSSMNGLPKLRHEVAVQRHMHGLGYPVAQPLLVEESEAFFGGPFMIMELLPGRTLLDELFRRFWRIVHAPVEMAEMQARLHRMPVDGFPAPAGDFLTRQLQELRDLIEEYDQDDLRPGLDWLEEHRPAAAADSSILHLD